MQLLSVSRENKIFLSSYCNKNQTNYNLQVGGLGFFCGGENKKYYKSLLPVQQNFKCSVW